MFPILARSPWSAACKHPSVMRWDRGHESPNVEDRRGEGFSGGGMGGLAMLLPLFGRFGWRGILVALVVLALLRYGGDCGGLSCGGAPDEESESRGAGQIGQGGGGASEDEQVQFVSYVLDDVQTTFGRAFEKAGERYQDARMVIFTDGVSTGCGSASSSVGPFYCPLDRTIYIDLSFYRELQRRFGAPGDFAEAYVIAHEVGHHVQRLAGRLNKDRGGAGSIETELQADCLAGAWARSAESRNLLEAGDLAEGMNAASAVGDDSIQKKSGGDVNPETWTHGSSAQRKRAFQRGYEGGSLDACGL
jgi:predicted metalloprotease